MNQEKSRMTQIFGYSISVPLWLALAFFGLLWVGLSFLVAGLFDKYIRRWANRTQTRFDKILVDALHGPLLIFLLRGGRILLSAVELTPKSPGSPMSAFPWRRPLC